MTLIHDISSAEARADTARVVATAIRNGVIDPEVFNLFDRDPEDLVEELGELISNPDFCEVEINGRGVNVYLNARGKEQLLLWMSQILGVPVL